MYVAMFHCSILIMLHVQVHPSHSNHRSQSSKQTYMMITLMFMYGLEVYMPMIGSANYVIANYYIYNIVC